MSYHPIDDEKKQYNLKEFVERLRHVAYEYGYTFEDTNEFHKGTHTFDEWMASFSRFMSW